MQGYCKAKCDKYNASTALICSYSAVSHDNHMQTTWHKSDWRNRIQKCHVSKPQKALDVYQTLSSFWGWGLETRLSVHHMISAARPIIVNYQNKYLPVGSILSKPLPPYSEHFRALSGRSDLVGG